MTNQIHVMTPAYILWTMADHCLPTPPRGPGSHSAQAGTALELDIRLLRATSCVELSVDRLNRTGRGSTLSSVCWRRGSIWGKGCGLKCPGWWECSLAAISQTTTHMHGHHQATSRLYGAGWGVSLGRELRALALSHTASVRRGTA